MARIVLILLLCAIPALAERAVYRLHAGEAVRLQAADLPAARSLKGHGLAILPDDAGNLVLAASLTAPPGVYTAGATLQVVLDPARPVPSNAARPPVILLNGYQLASLANLGVCQSSITSPHSRDTFGDLETNLLNAGAPIVYFFDNCVEGGGAKLEDLGGVLGQVIASIKFENGNAVPQVDLVAHSMGGLIVRAYLAGLQTDGTAKPPANPRVRKFVEIATPNFGSYLAANLARNPLISALLDDQARAMLPGSAFLLNLATWNQGGDDLRGVDALAIVGNKGTVPFPGASDGLATLTSASLGFASDAAHTRILPYCHTESSFIDCNGTGIAKAPETATITASFLAGTADWKSPTLSKTPDQDPYLSSFGGVYVAVRDALGQLLSSLGQVTFGPVTLNAGALAGVAYSEFTNGTATFHANLPGGAALDCGPFTQPTGFAIVIRCKASPAISSVGPLLSTTIGRVVTSGASITVRGTGFGATRCATCNVNIAPGGALDITSWTDTAIVATLPAAAQGLVQLTVATAAGSDRVNLMIAAATVGIESVTNGASFVSGFAPGGWVTIKGTGLANTTRSWAAADIVNGALPTSLDGVSVKINGNPAYVSYISPMQVNVLAPGGDRDTVASTTMNVEVTSPGGTARFTATRQRYAPAIFQVATWAAALNVDGTLVAPANAIPGVTSRPARLGEVIAIYVTGLGTGTTTPIDVGHVNPPVTLTDPVSVSIAGNVAEVQFAGLVGPGLYQINVKIPNFPGALDGPARVTISIGMVAGQNAGQIVITP